MIMNLHLDVQPFQETLNMAYCGPACLVIILRYFGEPDVSEKELAIKCNTKREHGTWGKDLKVGAESMGFKVELKDEATFEDIEEWLKKGVPPIVNWFTPGRTDYHPDFLYPEGHYSVVCGLDEQYIYLQDPEIGGMRNIPRDTFMGIWFDYEGGLMTKETLTPRRLIAIYK